MSTESSVSRSDMWDHLNEEVSGLKSDMSGVKTAIASLKQGQHTTENQLKEISRQQEKGFNSLRSDMKEDKPKQTNLIALGVFVVALIGLSAGGVTNYFSTRMTPTEKSQDKVVDIMWNNMALRAERSKEIGSNISRISENEKELESQWKIDHEQIAQIAKLQEHDKLTDQDRERIWAKIRQLTDINCNHGRSNHLHE